MAVAKLFENDDFIIVNKPYDMYINSDNENEKVSFNFLLDLFYVKVQIKFNLLVFLIKYFVNVVVICRRERTKRQLSKATVKSFKCQGLVVLYHVVPNS